MCGPVPQRQNKGLLRKPSSDQRNNSTQVCLGDPVSFLGLLTGEWVGFHSGPWCLQHHYSRAGSLEPPAQLEGSSTEEGLLCQQLIRVRGPGGDGVGMLVNLATF